MILIMKYEQCLISLKNQIKLKLCELVNSSTRILDPTYFQNLIGKYQPRCVKAMPTTCNAAGQHRPPNEKQKSCDVPRVKWVLKSAFAKATFKKYFCSKRKGRILATTISKHKTKTQQTAGKAVKSYRKYNSTSKNLNLKGSP